MNLTEAFKALNALTEETFSVSDDGIEKLSQFEDNDDLDDTLSIIDTEAETEEDLQDSYLGKVILDCCVCHSKLYKDKDDIKIDDEEDLANVGDECPYCASSDGYKIIGEVGKFEDSEDDKESEKTNESFNQRKSRRLTESSNSEDFEIEDGVLNKYVGPGGNVVIPNGVTRIGTHAFEFCDSLTSITIPNSVESIGDNAFNHCTSLKSITIGNSVKTIGDSAFYYCNSLTNVTIPNSVTAIRDDAFCYCDSLINVTIPNSVKSIGDEAFAGCDSLKSVTISDGITSIGDYAFYDCDSLSDITFKGNVNKINFGKKCFYGTPVEKELFKDNDKESGKPNESFNLKRSRRLKEAATKTKSRKNMSEIEGTLGNVFTKHSKELSMVHDKQSALDFLDKIKPEVKNKSYLDNVKEEIMKMRNSTKIIEYLYNIILKGDKMGTKVESFKQRKSHRLKEDVKEMSLTTDDTHLELNTDENGNTTLTTGPVTSDLSDSDEVLTPLSDETKTDIENNDIDNPEDDIDVDVDEFDEDSFDDLGESYFRKIYENVNRYKTTKVTSKGNSLVVEGLLKFKSGKTKKTSFIFEAKDYMRNGKARFIGENLQLTKGKKSFIVDGIIKDKKFISESFKYNYKASDNAGNKRDVRGSIKR